ncbi:eukaryotic translation elongation factor 1 epsilon-1 [Ischnura elegans]|uniref:eukaryotic translation elongation factor 1 epsilon-1 n=1 Tax=Ischnura elegans TaxID=197161 RepID=UPI001ED8AE33|nr:eukaryotic translation elongation factor 1 epsilon-1 [Ischnura elegans]
MVFDSSVIISVGKWLDVNCENISGTSSDVKIKCFNSGNSVNGPMSSILYLARQSSRSKVTGLSPDEEAEIRQWLEFGLLISQCTNNLIRRSMLKTLNEFISSRTFLVGNRMTVADVLMYQVLFSCMVEMNYAEKEQLLHLGRWFNFIQNDEMVRQGNKLVHVGRPLF